MKVVALDSRGWADLPDGVAKEKFIEVVNNAAKEVNKLLRISDNLNVILKPNLPHVIDVTGTGGSTFDAELVDITFDPKRAADDNFMRDIKAGVFHELNHASRFNAGIKNNSTFDWLILEGVATVFERQYVNYSPPWGEYDTKIIKQWVKELHDLGENLIWPQIMFKNPDGRRWIGYKVATYIVDEAIKNSKKNVIDLTYLENKIILKYSKVLD